ncbi:uncharacterized protein ASPGLDRAFT_25847 [Aspergillus glaucus CBS 516.65]|uniref:Uncharacterized protein n=1 Tax=Aspergillus glaucus CBS 516.65 TaxID=1160497 RepID=A0A1L9VKH6_ASPGL|nr:hypothetical protein ASPGLDRAFT_25847 [Aspergillus glaucus CBS 516.65]OJJ84404.1 hypothetical protein ASPGLDRAFT_25847 [Aspergillus glaucus CBS 516.65]
MYYGMGNWKRWLPFYGPVSVQEVKFQFVRAKGRDGLYEIRVTPVDIEQVEKVADRKIELNKECLANALITGEYCSDLYHHPDCPASIPEDLFGPQTCILDQAGEADVRKSKLNQLHLLKECARNPPMANGVKALDGMAQDSCIYNTNLTVV